MDIKEALTKARAEKKNINYFVEYDKSFVFSFDDGQPRRGGDSPIVVPKDGGECVNMLYAIQETDLIGEEPVSEGSLS